MFEDVADKIFKEAGVSKEDNPDAYQEAISILNRKMAILSVTMGLSKKAVPLFNEQKQALVDDLVEGKQSGLYK